MCRQGQEQLVSPLPSLISPRFMVMAGMNSKSKYGMYLFSSSRLAWLLVKKLGGQKATHELTRTNNVMNR